jgi:hypothetical protein
MLAEERLHLDPTRSCSLQILFPSGEDVNQLVIEERVCSVLALAGSVFSFILCISRKSISRCALRKPVRSCRC